MCIFLNCILHKYKPFGLVFYFFQCKLNDGICCDFFTRAAFMLIELGNGTGICPGGTVNGNIQYGEK
jgi:hypothetical protein